MAVRQSDLIAMLGMGDSGRNINKVLPEYTAMLTDLAVGYESGIAANYGSKFDYRLIEGGLIVQSGGCWAFGYAGFNRNDIRINLSAAGGSTRYVFIYVEFDLTGSAVSGTTVDACKVVTFDNGGNGSITYQQDNLRTMKTGKYQLPLYRVAVGSAGVTSDSITDLRTIRAKVKNAERADSAGFVDGTVNGTATVKSGANIENGVIAYTQATGNSSRNIATTEFVMGEIGKVKNISVGTITPASYCSADIKEVKRQVNFIIGRFTPRVVGNRTFKDLGAVPDGFRPKQKTMIYDGNVAGYSNQIYIDTNGAMALSSNVSLGTGGVMELSLIFGYEITQ